MLPVSPRSSHRTTGLIWRMLLHQAQPWSSGVRTAHTCCSLLKKTLDKLCGNMVIFEYTVCPISGRMGVTSEQREFGARMFGALGHPARLRILERLAEGAAPVKTIAQEAGLRQSMASQHLAVLFAAGAVVCRSNGNQRVYSLRGPRIARIIELVEEFHEVHLQHLLELLDRHAARSGSRRNTD